MNFVGISAQVACIRSAHLERRATRWSSSSFLGAARHDCSITDRAATAEDTHQLTNRRTATSSRLPANSSRSQLGSYCPIAAGRGLFDTMFSQSSWKCPRNRSRTRRRRAICEMAWVPLESNTAISLHLRQGVL